MLTEVQAVNRRLDMENAAARAAEAEVERAQAASQQAAQVGALVYLSSLSFADWCWFLIVHAYILLCCLRMGMTLPRASAGLAGQSNSFLLHQAVTEAAAFPHVSVMTPS